MEKRLKHLLPPCEALTHLSLSGDTLAELKQCVHQLENKFISVLEANKGLCGINHQLTEDVFYENFFQVPLTESIIDQTDVTLDDCKEVHESSRADGLLKGVRKRKQLSAEPNSPLNESTYSQKTAIYEQNRELFDKILSPLKGEATRIRLVRLPAGGTVSPHIDYDPAYAVRVIIPIISTPECLNIFWVKNEIHSYYLRPGVAYFLNIGYRHAVVNLSKIDRYTFMVSVKGQADIEHLLTPEKVNERL